MALDEMADGSSPSAPTVRGIALLGLLDWVRQTHAEPGLERALACMSEAAQARYAGPRPKVVATARIPAVDFADLAAAIIDAWGLPAYHEAAAHVAISDLNSYMKLFLKIGTPTFVLRRLPKVLGHYCSTGELVVVEVHDKTAVLAISGVGAYGRGISEGAVGWIRAALELSGAEDLTIETAMNDGGGRYHLRWG